MTDRHAEFSSYGPTADGRIKPDLSIAGEGVVTAGEKGLALTMSAGTSIASPILAGSLAALWSACPDCTADDILDLVFAHADQRFQPDNSRGYGLPDFAAAWLSLYGFTPDVWLCFDRAAEELRFVPAAPEGLPVEAARIVNILGQTVWTGYPDYAASGQLPLGRILNLGALPAGWYVFQQGAVVFCFGV
jgi:Subtilase family